MLILTKLQSFSVKRIEEFSALRRTRIWILLFLFLTLSTPLHPQMTELPIPFAPWDLRLPEQEGFLTRTASRFSVGSILYDSLGQSLRWSGSGEGEIILLSRAPFHWEWRLSMETTADDRNEIYFRVLRLYYQASTGLRIQLKENQLLLLGYQHRCSHGSDRADEGRILIRSGPKISYLTIHPFPLAELRLSGFIEPTLVGQNADFSHQERYLLGGIVEAEGKNLPLLVSLGGAVMGITRGSRDTFGFSSSYQGFRQVRTYSASVGIRFPGEKGTLTLLLRLSSIPDSGLTSMTSPLRWLGLYFLFDS